MTKIIATKGITIQSNYVTLETLASFAKQVSAKNRTIDEIDKPNDGTWNTDAPAAVATEKSSTTQA